MAKKSNAKRPDGLIKSKVYLGNGKYKYLYAHTQKELDLKVQEVKLKLGKGIDILSQRDLFSQWVERWLRIKKTEVSEKRYNSYKALAKRLSPLDNMQIAKIRMSDIQEIILDNCELSVFTLTSLKNTAKQIFDFAINNRVIDYNPAVNVRIPQKTNEDHTERRALTEEERSWIEDTPHRAQTAAMIMMYAGLRRGEMIPLLWSDIDFENKTISVNKSVRVIGGKLTVVHGKAKTENSIRTVHIPQKLVDYLKSCEKENLLVVVSGKNCMHTEQSWRSMWNSYLAELNFKYGDFEHIVNFNKPKSRFAPVKIPMVIPNITPHWLRHTFITLMYLAGVDVMTAMEQAGHSNIQTTMAIYTHLDKEYKQKSINKMDDYISGKKAQ